MDYQLYSPEVSYEILFNTLTRIKNIFTSGYYYCIFMNVILE
jgi:hypothetical protein